MNSELLERGTAVGNLRETSDRVGVEISLFEGRAAIRYVRELSREQRSVIHPARDPRWLTVLQGGLGHIPYLLEARHQGVLAGRLSLCLVKSFLFGRYLVSLPYVSVGGVDELDPTVAIPLIDRAASLADRLRCRFLELRHEQPISHPQFNAELTQKVQMRLELPQTEEELWDQLKSKVRSQVRKGLRFDFETVWGGEELLDEFYRLFAIRMHELGTPVFGRALFRQILREFPGEAELCCVRDGKRTIASALLVHGTGTTEVPSASSLMEYNSSNANMILYWNLLSRTVARGNRSFDFGRATRDSGTHQFKKQWGAEESPTYWQYYVREGSAQDLRPDTEQNRKRVEMWKKLPHWVTRICGPRIVRGIP